MTIVTESNFQNNDNREETRNWIVEKDRNSQRHEWHAISDANRSEVCLRKYFEIDLFDWENCFLLSQRTLWSWNKNSDDLVALLTVMLPQTESVWHLLIAMIFWKVLSDFSYVTVSSMFATESKLQSRSYLSRKCNSHCNLYFLIRL